MIPSTVIRAATLASAAFALAGAAHADVFMKASGVPGDARARGFESQIELNGASLSVMNMPTYTDEGFETGERTPHMSAISFNKSPDRASPRLLQAALDGRTLGSVEVTFTTPGRAGQTVDSRWILEGARINSFYVFPGATPGEVPVETVEIAYDALRFQHYVKDAKGVATGEMEEVRMTPPEQETFGLEGGCGG
jgi:type VI protein secretion system component Hcp